ncbi:iron chelate uptake ABC transporter family permease subunit [Brachybacterium sp. MASK1Z-5]|uniref:Iron chelate uptake ABC transporter family permease subunit n=1 Tax=Brachybacterium halotolerans TaxID=2795215 RepID=A0ABS1BAC4_9MICO|nr:iron chelate uptake ABC transporter family permease subunit [Brachybacterium halotolerans]MBK0331610.1 iron chelate uptake ABC transporter family permease subunit [Brachybacterium halotolerans]
MPVRIGPWSLLLRPRLIVTSAGLLGLAAGILLLSLCLGDTTIPPEHVVRAFTPDAPRLDRMVVVEWRAPRAVAALVFGACLGVSGAIFQSLTDNPLGSPDVIGLNTGAFSGVLVVMLLGGAGAGAIAGGAVLGGLLTAGLVYALAYRGGLQGFRLIIVGIAVSAMLASANTWFSVKAALDVSMQAAVWGAGTLTGLRWGGLAAVGMGGALLLLTLPWLSRWMRALELGDDTAAVLGVRTEVAKAVLVVVGVVLTSMVTAVAGPIAFIALAAPQIARRLRRSGSFDPIGSGLVGMLLLGGADLIAQHAVPGGRLPVGAVTVCIGGGYLVWLLLREGRRA